ncbi:immune inhibitor A [Candidatus Binatia bacterium]|nr:immune inhibitor A [Candidatus Binatia bacterium]
MHRLRATIAALLVLVAACLGDVEARAQSLVAAPGTSGDQLLFFYDATAGRTPFLVVSNLSPSALTLDIAWYPQDLGRRLATQRQTLAAGGNVVLDPSQVQGVNGNAGITVVTPIVEGAEARPVVPEPVNDSLASAPSGPLVGGFTLADLSTGSAFGQNPLARIAVTADGKRAAAGAVVDGTTVRYQRIAPDALTIPFYFDPSTAGFTNRAILGAFEDRYAADIFSIGPASVDLQVGLIDSTGADVASASITVNGVLFTDVQTLADATPLTSSGKVILGTTAPLPASANLLGLMSQSLGTFSVGQGLPGYFARKAPTIVLDNPDFDLGRVGWGQESQNFPGALIVEGGTGGAPVADSGTRLAWLGRVNGETSELSQVIDVPAGVGPSFIKFRYQIASEETECSQVTPVDTLLLFVDGKQVDGVVICAGFNTGPTWTDFGFVTDLADYAGKTIALRIRGSTNGTLPSSVFLDSLRIDSTPP